MKVREFEEALISDILYNLQYPISITLKLKNHLFNNKVAIQTPIKPRIHYLGKPIS